MSFVDNKLRVIENSLKNTEKPTDSTLSSLIISYFCYAINQYSLKMKKLLLSVAILVGATLILTQDNSDNLEKVSKQEVVTMQTKLQADSKFK
jgi:hypothetical protein